MGNGQTDDENWKKVIIFVGQTFKQWFYLPILTSKEEYKAMKQIYQFSLVLLAFLLPATTTAHDFMVDGIYYNINGNNAEVTHKDNFYGSYNGVITIPEIVTYNGTTYSVTSIGNSAFWGCEGLTSVFIPNSVTIIDDEAFFFCTGLTSLTIPNSVTSIGNAAFKGTAWYDNQPDGLVYAGLVAYNYKGTMPAGTHINIATGTKGIAGCAFDDCSSLKSVTIPNTVTNIGGYAFSGCSSLTSVIIPNSVTSIGDGAFYNCTSLVDLTLGESLQSIGKEAFWYDSKLRNVKCLSSTPPTMKNGTCFYDSNYWYATLYVPESSLSRYQSTSYWNRFYKIFPAIFDDEANILCSNIVLNLESSTILEGDTLLLLATITPEYATNNTVAWKSSNTSVATVNCNGNVNAISAGTARITATTIDGSNLSASCTVTVAEKQFATSISLNKSSTTLYVGETEQLVATVYPSNATNKTVTWKSSNTSVATVNSNGKVTAVSAGTATITATTTDGSNLSASCNVTVQNRLATSISLNKSSTNLYVGETEQLVATVYPSNTTNKTVTWKSSNKSVATVNSNGKVTAVSAGTATITATTTDGSNLSASCTVTVKQLATSISLNKSSTTIYVGGTEQLVATVYPSNTTNKTVTWKSSNTSVATVNSNGKVTAVSAGTARITATTTDGSNLSASCDVTVKFQKVTAITLNESSLVLSRDQSAQLIAYVQPDNASNKAITWTSVNSNIATVNDNGLVTAISSGTTTIKANATDGSGVYASCVVQVLPDYYLTMDTLIHVRGQAEDIVDFPISLTNRNGISAIQFDMSLPDCISFEDDGGLPNLWLDDNRKTRSHNLSVTMLGDNSCRVVIASTSSKELKGNEGPFVHMSIVLHKMHSIGNFTIQISNIIAAEADETRHTLSNAYSTVHCYYIVGDADSDASVDIADFNATGSKILLKNPSPFYSDAANVDNNNSIDVADLVGITNIAIGIKPITLRQAPRWNDSDDKLTCELLKLQSGEERDITLGMDCGFDFAGFQMDVSLPDGLSLTGAYLGQDASGLGLATAGLPDGSIRFLGASFSNVEITGDCPQLLTLRVKADNAYNYNEKISIDSIVFAERNLTSHYFDGSCIEFVEPSAVQELPSDVRIYVQNGNIIFDTSFAGLAQLISIDGRVLERGINVGHNVIEVNCSGIYIVNFGGKAIKVLL